MPLIHDDRVLGVLSLLSAAENAYSESDQSFINQLARQAAVAVINAELYREAQRRLKELSMLHLVSTRLVVNPELTMVMQTVARAMETSLRTSAVGIYLWDENTTAYRSRFYLQSPSQQDCNLPSVYLYADLEELQPALAKTGPLRITTKRGLGLISDCVNCQALVFPLVASKQRLGMVLIHIPKNQVVLDEELQLLRAIVAQVSISIQNALLFQDISRTRDRLSAVLNSAGEGILMLEMRQALMKSKNTCTVRILESADPGMNQDVVYKFARRLGIGGPPTHKLPADYVPTPKNDVLCPWVKETRRSTICMDRYPARDPKLTDAAHRAQLKPGDEYWCRASDMSIGLGSASLTMEEMIRAYSAFATGGKLVEPYYVEKVEDRSGTVLEQHEPSPPSPVMDPAVASITKRKHYDFLPIVAQPERIA